MASIVVSSDDIPADLDERSRFQMWRDHYMDGHGQLDLAAAPDAPLQLRFAFSWFGELGLGELEGTFDQVTRSARRIGAATEDTFCLVYNRRAPEIAIRYRDRDVMVGTGSAILLLDSEVADLRGPAANGLFFLPIPRLRLADRLADVEDVAGRLLDSAQPAVRHLGRYLEIVARPGELEAVPDLASHIGRTLLDLVVLAIAGDGAAARLPVAGPRAARLHEALVLIRQGFADPDFSPQRVSARLGVATRTVQDLLQRSGGSFTERVLELRLQHARRMLVDTRNDRMTVSDIALTCGFNEVSYFNRRFRARFGDTPTGLRHSRGMSA